MVFVVGYWFCVSNVFTLVGKVCISCFWRYLTVTFFNIRCDNRLKREQIFVLHWGFSEALCNKKGSQLSWRQLWGILTSLGISFSAGSDIFEGEEGVAFSEEALSMLEPALLLFQVSIHFMSIVFECFAITPCQVIMVPALSFSICSIFPGLSLYKLCQLLLAVTAVPFWCWLWGRGVPGVCVVAPGHWHRLWAMAHHFLPLAKHLGSADNKKRLMAWFVKAAWCLHTFKMQPLVFSFFLRNGNTWRTCSNIKSYMFGITYILPWERRLEESAAEICNLCFA